MSVGSDLIVLMAKLDHLFHSGKPVLERLKYKRLNFSVQSIPGISIFKIIIFEILENKCCYLGIILPVREKLKRIFFSISVQNVYFVSKRILTAPNATILKYRASMKATRGWCPEQLP